MNGSQRHPHGAVHENHQRMVALTQLSLYVLCVTGKTECIGVDGLLVDRSRDQHIYLTLTILLYGTFQSLERSLPALLGRQAEIHLDIIRIAVHHVQAVRLCIPGAVHHVEIRGRVYSLAVVCHHLGRPVHHRSTELKHCGVRKSLEYNLVSYAVYITLGDAYCYPFTHIFELNY